MAAAVKPKITSDEMYQLLREGRIKEFNKKKAEGVKCELIGLDFRAVDLREIDAEGLDFSNSYFRQADLRGINFSDSCLDGASINKASISGALFPKELSAAEVTLSLEHGTRMRYKVPCQCTCGTTKTCTCNK